MIIYKVTNLINGKIYIGLTIKSLEQRWRNHLKCYKQTEYAFHRALRKYGIENFKMEQIDEAETIDNLIKKETEWIDKLDSMNPLKGYNMIRQDDHIKFFSDEVKEKISQSQIIRLQLRSEEKKLAQYEKSSHRHQGAKKNKDKKYVGVYRNKNINSYSAEIRFKHKKYSKNYKTDLEAAQTYDKLAIYFYGGEARTNFSKNDYKDIDLESFIDNFLNIKGKRGKPRKLNKEQIKEIRSIGKSISQSEIAKKYGVSQMTISHILRDINYLSN